MGSITVGRTLHGGGGGGKEKAEEEEGVEHWWRGGLMKMSPIGRVWFIFAKNALLKMRGFIEKPAQPPRIYWQHLFGQQQVIVI